MIDVLDAVHTRLFAAAVEDNRFDDALLPYLDAIGEAVTEVRVEGAVSVTTEDSHSTNNASESGLEAGTSISTVAEGA